MGTELLIFLSAIGIAAVSSAILFILQKLNVVRITPKKSDSQSDKIAGLESELSNIKKDYNLLVKKNQELQYRIKTLNTKTQALRTTSEEIEVQTEMLENSKGNISKLKGQKEEMLRMVHDIKNPASAIQNFVQLLESYELNNQEQAEVMELLIRTSKRLVKISDDMTKTIATNLSNFDLEITSNNINSVVNNVYKAFKFNAEKKSLQLKLMLDDSIQDIGFDSFKIEEAVENLVDNAIKYSYPDHEVVVKTKNLDAAIELSISDSGPGISARDMDKIFNKGVTTQNQPTGGESSTGLGLWIVKTIVEAHAGKVKVVSREGAGSIFSFILPKQVADSSN